MWFTNLLICAVCGEPVRETAKSVICRNGHESTRRDDSVFYAETGSADWQGRQGESVERYEDEHYEEDPRAAQMFGNFIAAGIDRDETILDIGCGISAALPLYVEQLRLERYLGLEPLTVPAEREYGCLVGAIAEKIPLEDHSIDGVLFATSLDHIEAEDEAIAQVRRVLRPNGRIFLWQGLHEPEMLAAAKTFDTIFNKGSKIKRSLRIALAYPEYAYLLYRMIKRRRQLATGADIDGVHFRYYTRKTLQESLDRWGLEVKRELIPPGLPCVFIEAVERVQA